MNYGTPVARWQPSSSSEWAAPGATVYSDWVWDADRKKHYRFNSNTKHYEYEDGEKVPAPQENTGGTTGTSAGHTRDVSQGSSGWSEVSGGSNFSGADSITAQSSGAPGNQAVSAYAPQPGVASSSAGNYGNSRQNTQASSNSGYETPVPGSHQNTDGFGNQRSANEQDEVSREVEIQSGPHDQGTISRMKILATKGTEEKLHPAFRVRTPGYWYFKVGVVFRMLWPELAGDPGNITIATEAPFGQKRVFCRGEQVFCKTRWFVVIREGHDCCTCLSIQTYQGRGVTPTKVKCHHAPMYTGPSAPKPLDSELPSHPNELPMGEAIRVISDQGRDPWNSKMDPRSRVNLVKLYTIEHNVKVDIFGRVDREDEWKLISQFNSLWGRHGQPPLPPFDRHSSFLTQNVPQAAQGGVATQDMTSVSQEMAAGPQYPNEAQGYNNPSHLAQGSAPQGAYHSQQYITGEHQQQLPSYPTSYQQQATLQNFQQAGLYPNPNPPAQYPPPGQNQSPGSSNQQPPMWPHGFSAHGAQRRW